jgi:hypothetical protein
VTLRKIGTLKKNLVQCHYAHISFFSTQKQCTLRHFIHNSTAVFPYKPYTLAGIEPGSSKTRYILFKCLNRKFIFIRRPFERLWTTPRYLVRQRPAMKVPEIPLTKEWKKTWIAKREHVYACAKQGDQGSMLRSQFSAIFTNCLRKNGVFLINQCYDQLIAKFSIVFCIKKRQFLRRFFGENI